MRKTTALLALLVLLVLSFGMPLIAVQALPGETFAGPPIPSWTVVILTASGGLILIAWSQVMGFINLEIGKPPPAEYSISDDDLNMDSTNFPSTLLTSVLNGNMVGTGHNYS